MSDFIIKITLEQFLEIYESLSYNKEAISPDTLLRFREALFEKWNELKNLERKSKLDEWLNNQKSIINTLKDNC